MSLRLALVLIVFLYPGLLLAQYKQYHTVHYNTDNGLPQNSITGIQFDNKGYCWLGTEMGLVRFDGTKFKVFGFKNIDGLTSERVHVVGSDARGVFFAKMDNGQLISTEMPVATSAPKPQLLKNDNIWVSGNGFAAELPFTPRTADSLLNAPVHDGVERFRVVTPSGDVYMVVNNKTYYVDRSGLTLIDSQSRPYNINHGVIGNQLIILRSDGSIRSWQGKTPQKHPGLIAGPVAKNPAYIAKTFTLIHGSGAYIYAGKTIYELYFENGRFNSKVLFEDIDIKNLYTIVYNDEQDKYYLGSLTSGLYILSNSLFRYPPMPRQAIAEFRSQVTVEDDTSIICEQYLYRKNSYTKLPVSRSIGATAYADAHDNMYYGMTAGLFKFSLRNLSNRKLFELDSRPVGIMRDRWDGNCLLLSTSFSIAKIYNDTLKALQKVTGRETWKAIRGITQIGKDTLLLWTQGGLKWYDFKANRIFRSILDSMAIHCVYTDTGNRIWISTYGKGFFLYSNGKITSLPPGPAGALRAVHAFVDDGKGNLWLPTNNGLYKVSKENLLAYASGKAEDIYYYAFSTQNGLRSNEFNGGSIPGFLWLKDSMLSLSTIEGPVWFYPNKIQTLFPDKGIYIEQIHIGQEPVQCGTGPLILVADHGRLSVEISSPYFGNRENMQLRFRIEGLDEEWRDVADNGDIVIERMPAGSYSLVVRNTAAVKPGQYIRLMLPIQVRPYWYNTKLFYLLLLVLSVIGVYWLIKLRTRLLKIRNRKLKMQVALQTRNLNRMVHQLKQSEEALIESNQTKDNIITTVLHDLRSPIRFIYTISRYVASGYREMQQKKLDMHLQELKNSTASLNSFTDQFFTWALSQHRTFSAKYSMQALADLFLETQMLYTNIIIASGNTLVVVPTEINVYTDPQLLTTIIRNLLDNANKYTRKGTVKLSAMQSENKVIITVSDTGIGFQPDALKAFLNKDQPGTGNGRGSFIILNLLELLGGQLEVFSEPGRGTTFNVTLLHQDRSR